MTWFISAAVGCLLAGNVGPLGAGTVAVGAGAADVVGWAVVAGETTVAFFAVAGVWAAEMAGIEGAAGEAGSAEATGALPPADLSAGLTAAAVVALVGPPDPQAPTPITTATTRLAQAAARNDIRARIPRLNITRSLSNTVALRLSHSAGHLLESVPLACA
jgi:hypothetical protein